MYTHTKCCFLLLKPNQMWFTFLPWGCWKMESWSSLGLIHTQLGALGKSQVSITTSVLVFSANLKYCPKLSRPVVWVSTISMVCSGKGKSDEARIPNVSHQALQSQETGNSVWALQGTTTKLIIPTRPENHRLWPGPPAAKPLPSHTASNVSPESPHSSPHSTQFLKT